MEQPEPLQDSSFYNTEAAIKLSPVCSLKAPLIHKSPDLNIRHCNGNETGPVTSIQVSPASLHGPRIRFCVTIFFPILCPLSLGGGGGKGNSCCEVLSYKGDMLCGILPRYRSMQYFMYIKKSSDRMGKVHFYLWKVQC